jgi:hypothetical protein
MANALVKVILAKPTRFLGDFIVQIEMRIKVTGIICRHSLVLKLLRCE